MMCESILKNMKYCETGLSEKRLVELLMMERSGMGLREQKDEASQETCVKLGAEFRGPNCQSCLLFATARPRFLRLPPLTHST